MNEYLKIRVSAEEKAEVEAEALLRSTTMNAVLRERLFADKQRILCITKVITIVYQ